MTRRLRMAGWMFLCLLVALPGQAQRACSYTDADIRTVIADIEAQSAYRFLYRDALISDKTVSFTCGEADLLDALDAALAAQALTLHVDAERKQVLLAAQPKPTPQPQSLIAHVVDAETGMRLSFATVTWREQGRLRGAVANEAGTVQLTFGAHLRTQPTLTLTASYVGFLAETVTLATDRLPSELPFRLEPEQTYAPEVLVHSAYLSADLDTAFHSLLRPGLHTPLGESSAIRALQPLPAVSFSSTLHEGLNVRGSKEDGFQVLLDGISVYNQSHLFGLFDALNQDALQVVGFYYDVPPASLQGPPGGTLAFSTRTGSQTQYRARLGLSNTAARGLLEGPLFAGKGSFLVALRRSYLDAISWFNNDELVALGLTLSQPGLTSLAPSNRAVTFNTPQARYYDAHAKLYYETDAGHRWMLNGYHSADATQQAATRFTQRRAPNGGPLDDQPTATEVTTDNTWGNTAASLQHQRLLSPRTFATVTLGHSRYASAFSKDDFLYTTNTQPNQDPRDRHLFRPFSNENDLYETKLATTVDVALQPTTQVAFGFSSHQFIATYLEDSISRINFEERRASVLLDAFGEVAHQVSPWLSTQLGLRSHYYSAGAFWRLSPRLKLRFREQQPLSFGVGYSRNHQFLHRLSLEQYTSTNIWVLSTVGEPPGHVDNLSGGLYWRAYDRLFIQVEAYQKRFENLRQHETVLGRRTSILESILLAPWLPDVRGRARGLEVMTRWRLGPVQWTQSYTWSKVELRHDRFKEGLYFPADWDRRHQYTSLLDGRAGRGWSWQLTWVYATGAPNPLADLYSEEPTYLGHYHRLDASLSYEARFPQATLSVRLGAYNLYNRDNPWYRTPTSVLLRSNTNQPRLDFVNTDVYDLGFHPSFELMLAF